LLLLLPLLLLEETMPPQLQRQALLQQQHWHKGISCSRQQARWLMYCLGQLLLLLLLLHGVWLEALGLAMQLQQLHPVLTFLPFAGTQLPAAGATAACPAAAASAASPVGPYKMWRCHKIRRSELCLLLALCGCCEHILHAARQEWCTGEQQ
jgi:hypothetical protein